MNCGSIHLLYVQCCNKVESKGLYCSTFDDILYPETGINLRNDISVKPSLVCHIF